MASQTLVIMSAKHGYFWEAYLRPDSPRRGRAYSPLARLPSHAARWSQGAIYCPSVRDPKDSVQCHDVGCNALRPILPGKYVNKTYWPNRVQDVNMKSSLAAVPFFLHPLPPYTPSQVQTNRLWWMIWEQSSVPKPAVFNLFEHNQIVRNIQETEEDIKVRKRQKGSGITLLFVDPVAFPFPLLLL